MEQVRDKDGGHPQLFTPHVDGDGVNIFVYSLWCIVGGRGQSKCVGGLKLFPQSDNK